jgi:alanine dehydrogenase
MRRSRSAEEIAMRIGVPKEIKDHEFRVGITPEGVHALCAAGHEVLVEKSAGAAIGFPDEQYVKMGAQIVPGPTEVYACELVVKVKEPQPAEIPLIRPELSLFCYLHLAAAPELAEQLMQSHATCIAYETVIDEHGHLPLLTPMSQVAGRLSVQMGAWALIMANGGSGVLLPGVPGVAPGKVTILGGGVVGTNAAQIALGMGADVTLLERNPATMRRLEEIFGGRLKTGYSTPASVESGVREADLVIGAVLIPGKHAPKLITRELVKSMRPRSVIVDISIDQGGCCETSRPTTHSDPIYIEEGVVHYCVANLPAATARTSTLALTHATLPYVLELADKGIKRALLENAGLKNGLNVCAGHITLANLAEDLGYPVHRPDEALA